MIKMLRALLGATFPAGLIVMLAASSLSACSMWPFHSAMPSASFADATTTDAESTLPPLQPDHGRICFFRMGSFTPDALVRPEIRVNGKVVGSASAGGYFLVDLPPGVYSAVATWNIDRPLSVYVAPGRTSYVQVEFRFPILTGRVVLNEASQRTAINMISTLDYKGGGGN
jgi:hypothetical protein